LRRVDRRSSTECGPVAVGVDGSVWTDMRA
jgi:hypothetical protein